MLLPAHKLKRHTRIRNSVILPLFIRYALERGTEHVAFVYDGLLLLNVSLAAFPDAKMWQVWDVRVRGWCAAR